MECLGSRRNVSELGRTFQVLWSISMLPGGEGVPTGVLNRRDINNMESVLLSLNAVQNFVCSFYKPAGLQKIMV